MYPSNRANPGEQFFTSPRSLVGSSRRFSLIRFAPAASAALSAPTYSRASSLPAWRERVPNCAPSSISAPTARSPIGNRDWPSICASTAAGPAFEAGAIRMGMRAVHRGHRPRHPHRGDALCATLSSAMSLRAASAAAASSMPSQPVFGSGRRSVNGRHRPTARSSSIPSLRLSFFSRLTFASCNSRGAQLPQDFACSSGASAHPQAISPPSTFPAPSETTSRSTRPFASACLSFPTLSSMPPAIRRYAAQKCSCARAKNLHSHRSSTSASPQTPPFRTSSPPA